MNPVATLVMSLGLAALPAALSAADKSLSLLDAEARRLGELHVAEPATWRVDLRLSGGQEVTAERFTYRYADTSGNVINSKIASDADRSLQIYRLETVVQVYPGDGALGVVLGAGIFGGNFRGGGAADHFHGAVGGLEAKAGLAYRLSPQAHLELVAFTGYGRNKYTLEGDNVDGSDANGNGEFTSVGGSLGAFYTISSGLQFGATFGYAAHESEAMISYNSDLAGAANTSAQAKISGDAAGALAMVGIGIRF